MGFPFHDPPPEAVTEAVTESASDTEASLSATVGRSVLAASSSRFPMSASTWLRSTAKALRLPLRISSALLSEGSANASVLSVKAGPWPASRHGRQAARNDARLWRA